MTNNTASLYFMFIPGKRISAIVKIGEVGKRGLNKRANELQHEEGLEVLGTIALPNADKVDRLMAESELRCAVRNLGGRHYGNDHFEVALDGETKNKAACVALMREAFKRTCAELDRRGIRYEMGE